MKKVLLSLVLFFLFISSVYSEVTDDQIRQAASILGVPFNNLKQFVQSYQQRNTPNDIMQLNIVKLFEDYRANTARAENQYKGCTFQYTGEVGSILTYSIGFYIRDRSSSYTVWVNMLESERYKLINLDIGQTITIVGRFEEINQSLYSPSITIRNAYILD